jgi:prevent-host-death family protein
MKRNKELKMILVSATKLRNNLFKYLDKTSKGEIIIIQRNNEEVARLVPAHKINWRDKMDVKLKILVKPEELIKPLEGIWEEYV